MNIYPTPSPTSPESAHAIREYTTGFHTRIVCTCGYGTGPVPGDRYAQEVYNAHVDGAPIEAPVRPQLLGNIA